MSSGSNNNNNNNSRSEECHTTMLSQQHHQHHPLTSSGNTTENETEMKDDSSPMQTEEEEEVVVVVVENEADNRNRAQQSLPSETLSTRERNALNALDDETADKTTSLLRKETDDQGVSSTTVRSQDKPPAELMKPERDEESKPFPTPSFDISTTSSATATTFPIGNMTIQSLLSSPSSVTDSIRSTIHHEAAKHIVELLHRDDQEVKAVSQPTGPNTSTDTSASSSSSRANPPAYCQALTKVPHLVRWESDPVRFLHSAQGNVAQAATRLIQYWEERYRLFGPDRAFLPLTLTGQGALNETDIALLQSGLLTFLPRDSAGRTVLFFDTTVRTTDQSQANDQRPAGSHLDQDQEEDQVRDDRASRLRCLFYMIAIATQENTPFVIVRYATTSAATPTSTSTNTSTTTKTDLVDVSKAKLAAKLLHLAPAPPMAAFYALFRTSPQPENQYAVNDDEERQRCYQHAAPLLKQIYCSAPLINNDGDDGDNKKDDSQDETTTSTSTDMLSNTSFQVIVAETPQAMISELQQVHQFDASALPPSVGGTWSYDNFTAWITCRRQLEKSMWGAAATTTSDGEKGAEEAAREEESGQEQNDINMGTNIAFSEAQSAQKNEDDPAVSQVVAESIPSSSKIKQKKHNRDTATGRKDEKPKSKRRKSNNQVVLGDKAFEAPEESDDYESSNEHESRHPDDFAQPNRARSASADVDSNATTLNVLATAADSARVEERKARKRQMDVIYARQRRQREKKEEESLSRQCVGLRRKNLALKEEGQRLQRLVALAHATVDTSVQTMGPSNQPDIAPLISGSSSSSSSDATTGAAVATAAAVQNGLSPDLALLFLLQQQQQQQRQQLPPPSSSIPSPLTSLATGTMSGVPAKPYLNESQLLALIRQVNQSTTNNVPYQSNEDTQKVDEPAKYDGRVSAPSQPITAPGQIDFLSGNPQNSVGSGTVTTHMQPSDLLMAALRNASLGGVQGQTDQSRQLDLVLSTLRTAGGQNPALVLAALQQSIKTDSNSSSSNNNNHRPSVGQLQAVAPHSNSFSFMTSNGTSAATLNQQNNAAHLATTTAATMDILSALRNAAAANGASVSGQQYSNLSSSLLAGQGSSADPLSAGARASATQQESVFSRDLLSVFTSSAGQGLPASLAALPQPQTNGQSDLMSALRNHVLGVQNLSSNSSPTLHQQDASRPFDILSALRSNSFNPAPQTDQSLAALQSLRDNNNVNNQNLTTHEMTRQASTPFDFFSSIKNSSGQSSALLADACNIRGSPSSLSVQGQGERDIHRLCDALRKSLAGQQQQSSPPVHAQQPSAIKQDASNSSHNFSGGVDPLALVKKLQPILLSLGQDNVAGKVALQKLLQAASDSDCAAVLAASIASAPVTAQAQQQLQEQSQQVQQLQQAHETSSAPDGNLLALLRSLGQR